MEEEKLGKHRKGKVSRSKEKGKEGCLPGQMYDVWIISGVIRNTMFFEKRMIKTNKDIIGEQCIRNDDGVWWS